MQESERDLALRVYAMAMRAKVATLRVHTVALGTCLLRGGAVDTHASDLATAVKVHRNVQVRVSPSPVAPHPCRRHSYSTAARRCGLCRSPLFTAR